MTNTKDEMPELLQNLIDEIYEYGVDIDENGNPDILMNVVTELTRLRHIARRTDDILKQKVVDVEVLKQSLQRACLLLREFEKQNGLTEKGLDYVSKWEKQSQDYLKNPEQKTDDFVGSILQSFKGYKSTPEEKRVMELMAEAMREPINTYKKLNKRFVGMAKQEEALAEYERLKNND